MRPRIALTLMLALSLRSGIARAQVSPGPLSSPHASLDTGAQCFRCHPADRGKSSMELRCLECHGEIASMRASRRGFHARPTEKACSSCHPDHGGRDFALIAWDAGKPEKFDHAQSGWTLEGKHAAVACRDCHKPAFQKNLAVVRLLKRKDHAQSWLGLDTACASCHADPHRGSLGNDCTSCHSLTGWHPAPGFDHAKTKFALTGAHIKPECAKCHATATLNAGTDAKGVLKPRWAPVPHADCVACHKDPHAGRFTGACARCHVTSDWKAVNKNGFDHEQTRYPLRGAHAKAKCESCHDPKAGGAKPRFARCTDCHKDTHAGTATLAGKPADCAVCHDVNAFKPSIWPRAEHQRTHYPLDGAHALAACEGCHTRAAAGTAEAVALGSARVRMRPKATACTSCHRDPHAGRFQPGGLRPHQAGCLACHSMSAFVPSKYDGRAHADCVFPLEGAHMAIPCQRCHKELERPSDSSTLVGSTETRPLRFDSKARVCRDCHEDAHRGQFATRKDKGACESCHGFASFIPASKFDHDRDSEFKLQGAHARTPCAACHRNSVATAGTPSVVVFKPTPTRCEQCHAPAGTEPERRAAPDPRPGRPPRSRSLSRTGR